MGNRSVILTSILLIFILSLSLFFVACDNSGGGNAGGDNTKPPHICDYQETANLQPTCLSAGYIKYACSCGKTKETTLEKIDHDGVRVCDTCNRDFYFTFLGEITAKDSSKFLSSLEIPGGSLTIDGRYADEYIMFMFQLDGLPDCIFNIFVPVIYSGDTAMDWRMNVIVSYGGGMTAASISGVLYGKSYFSEESLKLEKKSNLLSMDEAYELMDIARRRIFNFLDNLTEYLELNGFSVTAKNLGFAMM